MSKIMAHIIEQQEQGIDLLPGHDCHEPSLPEDDPAFDCGIWYQSSMGGWYRNKDAAGDIVTVRVYGHSMKAGEEFDACFAEWWKSLDKAMQSDNPPFSDDGEPIF